MASPIPHGASSNFSLPFPASDSTFVNRTSSAMMASITASASLRSSQDCERSVIESNDEDNDDDGNEEPGDTITQEPSSTSPRARALHNVTWTSSLRHESESKSCAPPKCSKCSVNGSRTSRKPTSKVAPHSNKSGSDSDSNHASQGRRNHDLTEKRYRKILNYQFENLLAALPAHLIAESEGSIGGPDDRREKRISKAEVLMLAKSYIEQLERQHLELEAENRQQGAHVKRMEDAWLRNEGHF
jgi:hypothetical protein